jgi:diguanylate cyclase (GGDEF)-like protein/PAS domain S-box-containing protein
MTSDARLESMLDAKLRLTSPREARSALAELAAESLRLTAGTGAIVELVRGGESVIHGAAGRMKDVIGVSTPDNRSFFGVPLPLADGVVDHDSESSGLLDIDACRTAGVRSALLVPLRHGERILGLVSVLAETRGAFTAEDATMMEVVSGFAAAAVAREEDFEEREARIAERTVTLFASLDRQNRYIGLLQEISSAANEAPNVESAIRVALEKICETYGWSAGRFYIKGDEADSLLATPLWHSRHDSKLNPLRRMGDGTSVRRGAGLVGEVFASRAPGWISDVRESGHFVRNNVAASIGVRSCFALPVLVDDAVGGVLEFYSEHLIDPDERMLDVMRNVGAQLGHVIERKRAQLNLAASERRYRALFERNLAGVFRTTTNGVILECNDAFARILGLDSAADVMGRSLVERFVNPDDREHFLRHIQRERFLSNFEAEITKMSGARAWTLLNVGLISSLEADTIEGTILDISERKEMEERIAFQAHHDPLTGLHNRTFFIEQLDREMSRARRMDSKVGLLYIDLDGFKPVNDTHGHAVGDRVLREVAGRLDNCVRRTDYVGRMGGDEFTLLLTSAKRIRDAEIVAQKILESLAEPFETEGHTFSITASIGIAFNPEHADTPDEIIHAADSAMYQAKKQGRARYLVFDPR